MMEAVYAGYYDEHGNAVAKNPITHPMSYDGYVTYRAGENSEANETAYSDRLLREDPKKVRELMQKHFGEQGDYWSGRAPKKIEAFLREFLNAPKLRLVYIMQYCHKQSAYPYWRFEFNKNGAN